MCYCIDKQGKNEREQAFDSEREGQRAWAKNPKHLYLTYRPS